jgi:hypothetical protein
MDSDRSAFIYILSFLHIVYYALLSIIVVRLVDGLERKKSSFVQFFFLSDSYCRSNSYCFVVVVVSFQQHRKTLFQKDAPSAVCLFVCFALLSFQTRRAT